MLRGRLRGPRGRTRSRWPSRSGCADPGPGSTPRGRPVHLAGGAGRPDWSYDHDRFGGIITDIASHQIDQFLWLAGATTAEVVASTVANYTHPDNSKMQDFGEVLLRSESAQGYIRVDWYTPRGLPTWGDGRLIVLGTEGYLEIRKYVDLRGRPGRGPPLPGRPGRNPLHRLLQCSADLLHGPSTRCPGADRHSLPAGTHLRGNAPYSGGPTARDPTGCCSLTVAPRYTKASASGDEIE